MKKIHLAFASIALAAGLTACSGNDSGSTTTSTSDNTTTRSADSSTAGTSSTSDSGNKMASTPATSTTKTPLSAADSTFVVKAAAGGMMEVEGGKTAQQNGQSDRVKAFGNMMVTDHTAANQELMSLASAHGLTVPSALPADMQKHMDAMQKMKGKEFDSHYIGMMVNDHKKDIADFEKEANSGKDADIKAFAAKTLPTLKAHLDSAQAINKGKM